YLREPSGVHTRPSGSSGSVRALMFGGRTSSLDSPFLIGVSFSELHEPLQRSWPPVSYRSAAAARAHACYHGVPNLFCFVDTPNLPRAVTGRAGVLSIYVRTQRHGRWRRSRCAIPN